uniref:Uncharacterized protein n=1 Tax=Rhipicephalus microplus TaxID=6941 RepID=A0A6G5A499_RHIMP
MKAYLNLCTVIFYNALFHSTLKCMLCLCVSVLAQNRDLKRLQLTEYFRYSKIQASSVHCCNTFLQYMSMHKSAFRCQLIQASVTCTFTSRISGGKTGNCTAKKQCKGTKTQNCNLSIKSDS